MCLKNGDFPIDLYEQTVNKVVSDIIGKNDFNELEKILENFVKLQVYSIQVKKCLFKETFFSILFKSIISSIHRFELN